MTSTRWGTSKNADAQEARERILDAASRCFDRIGVPKTTVVDVARDDAYKWVQAAAMDTWRTGEPFERSVRGQEEIVSRMDSAALDEVFKLDSFLKEVDAIFDRVL